MRTTYIYIIALCLALAGCASPPRASNPAAKMPSPVADLLLISAVYGSGTSYVDVTYRVNDLIRQGDVVFFARPEWLQKDPTPGWNKALVIVYEYKGQRHTFATGEGGRVSADVLIAHARK